MGLRMLLLNLSLLCVIAAAVAEPQLAFYIPCQLRSEQTGRACLDVKQNTAPLNINAVLEVNGNNYTIINNEEVPVAFSFKCYDFQVPLVSEPVPVFVTIRATGGSFNYTERRAVVVAPRVNVTFIHLNKYVFKAGDTVRCYVFTLQDSLKPVEETYLTIYAQDPAGNRMFQWDNQRTENGFLKIEMELLDDQDPGQYTVTVVGANSGTSSNSFIVDQYVLPKVRLNVDAPSSITILDKHVSYKATAMYTYGLGVPGKVTVRACRAPTNYYIGNTCNRDPDGICSYDTGNLDSNGTFSGNLDLTPFQLDRPGYNMAITMQVTVTEEGTGVQTTESKYIGITSQLAQATFNRNRMPTFYKPGILYPVEVAVKDAVGQPLANQTVELQVNGLTVQNMSTDGNGTAQFDLETSNFTDSTIGIQVIYKNAEQCYDSNWIVPNYANDHFQITRFYSRSDCYIQILSPKEDLQCGQTYEMKIQYSFSKECLREGETTAKFVHMVMSRSRILSYGENSADMTTSLKGEFTISLKATSELAPEAELIVYYMAAEELVADTAQLSTEKCFSNQVSAAFSEEMGTPGSNVTLGIKAAAESMCATRIRDASLLLMKQGNPITADSVYSSYQFNVRDYYASGYNVEPAQPPCIDPNQRLKSNGIYYMPVDSPAEGDVYQLFKALCVQVIGSNITINKPMLCGSSRRPVPIFALDGLAPSRLNSIAFRPEASFAEAGAPAPPAEIVSVRTEFPELWRFELTHVGESGSASVPLQVPGTITEWKADMICLSNTSGIGMTKQPANFTAFQKFFTGVSFPNSIVRGEILILKAFVSNHLDKCAKVTATLNPSSDYTSEAGNQESVQCICSGQRALYSWKLNATSLGVLNISVTGETVHIGDSCDGPADPTQALRKDTIVQPFTVKAEGIEKEATKTNFICTNGTSVVIPISISTPENTVEDSAKVSVTVIGDIFGRALTNPESLNREPTGCGEQTIASLMPLAIAVDYLNKTGRLTKEYETRAVQNMGIGYRRILTFKNYDGSFSVFPGGKPSAWLTLKVLETLQLVAQHTFVDKTIINQGLVNLERLQDPTTGCFMPTGMVFNNDLKGGADGKISFTAAMVVFLANSFYASTPTLLRSALGCLDAASKDNEQSTYNQVMMFLAFRVTGNAERSNALLEILKGKAIVEDGTVHLERLTKPEPQPFLIFPPQAAAPDIEMTASFLQGLAAGSAQTAEEINYMSMAALWLARQQSASGSYSSTSDTVEVLKGLSAFATVVGQKGTDNAVTVTQGDEVIRQFNLNANNRLLVQTQPLSHIPGNYSMSVTGNGCVLLQTTVQFNIPVSQENAAFSLSVSTPSVKCVNGVAYEIPVQINVSYHGFRNRSNMALIKMPLLSGYTVAQSSFNKLSSPVSKLEVKGNSAIIYIDEVSDEVISIPLQLELTDIVSNLQPQTMLVFDYYEKGENGATVMSHPCSN